MGKGWVTFFSIWATQGTESQDISASAALIVTICHLGVPQHDRCAFKCLNIQGALVLLIFLFNILYDIDIAYELKNWNK